MYKKIIYLSQSLQENNIENKNYNTEAIINKIVDELEIILENTSKYIVYRNNPGMILDDIITQSNRIEPDIHVAIHINVDEVEGTEIFVYKPGIKSEILAKDIYSSIHRVYYNKSYVKGIKYDTKIQELSKTMATALKIEINANINDIKWIKNNTYIIAQAIADGINTYFKKISV